MFEDLARDYLPAGVDVSADGVIGIDLEALARSVLYDAFADELPDTAEEFTWRFGSQEVLVYADKHRVTVNNDVVVEAD